MVQEKEQPPAMVTQMVVVSNWFEELKRRVPAAAIDNFSITANGAHRKEGYPSGLPA